MRIGVLLMPTDPWPETRSRVTQLEEWGYDHVWVYDHLSWRRYRGRPWFSAMPWLTAVAEATDSIRIGTMVANPNIQHPLNLAQDAITLDHISSGRLTLGVGAGGTGFDATVLGAEPLSPGQRVARLGEFLDVVRGALDGTIGTYTGDYFVVSDAVLEPSSYQQPRLPVVVAAGSPRTIDLASRFGDGWVTWGDASRGDLSVEGTLAAAASQITMLRDRCAEVGNSFDDMMRMFLIGNTEDRPLASVTSFASFARAYADLGFTDLVFHHPRPDDPVWTDDPAIVQAIGEIIGEFHDMGT